MTTEPERTDNRLLRGQKTRQGLMHAAEKLIAEKGLGEVSIREIVREAQQSNASALQYHFGNLHGLIDAIRITRGQQVQVRRTELMAELLQQQGEPSLREVCALMIRPAFDLARAHPDFRRFVKAFGHQLLFQEDSVRAVARGSGGESGHELAHLLRQRLPHLTDKSFQQRMDFAVRLCASAMYTQARASNAFHGPQSDFFIDGLVDALVGLMSAAVSDNH